MTAARRVGVMGGTFDPIHHGHLVAAAQVAEQLELSEVVFVPTGQPWQKHPGGVSDAEHRYLMTLLATIDNPSFSVSRVDIERGGPTYTVDTVADLAEQWGLGVELFFITGADALASIMSWRDHERLADMAHFVGVTRPGHDLVDPGLPSGRVTLVEISALAISSTECRQRAAAGLTLEYLVPTPVAQYIAKNGLYRG